MDASIRETARLLALQNAVKFKGKANPKALIGGMVGKHPECKQDMPGLARLLDEVAAEVNALSPERQHAELLKLNPEYDQQKQELRQQRREERKELPELEGAEQGKVVTRIPPEPSKYNHLGHALSFLINYLYAKKYEGKCLMRFEDTNPEKESQEFVDAMREDVLEYLDIRPDAVRYASDDMPRFYECAEKLLRQGDAYVCSCSSEEMSLQRREMVACSHSVRDIEQNLAWWQEMLAGKHADGSSVVRLKIDMKHKNAVMRDPVIIRIVTTPHFRQGEKYKVWPMYDFENALEDSWMGTTHVLRSNEFESRIELQAHLQGLFGLKGQFVQQYGRFNITGATTQGREIRQLIEEKKVIGWDDPRLITLRALKRRGIVKEAYYELAKACGMSKTQTNLDFSVLAAINRRILDEEADRYSFVKDPVEITVEGMPATLASVELKLHPHKQRGGRPFRLSNRFFLAREDYEQVRDGKAFRLIDTCNLRFDAAKGAFAFHSESVDEFRAIAQKERHGLMHYLPSAEGQALLKARVFKAQGDRTLYEEGLLDPNAAGLKVGAIVQFERHCFARLDAVEADGTRTFWYTHD